MAVPLVFVGAAMVLYTLHARARPEIQLQSMDFRIYGAAFLVVGGLLIALNLLQLARWHMKLSHWKHVHHRDLFWGHRNKNRHHLTNIW